MYTGVDPESVFNERQQISCVTKKNEDTGLSEQKVVFSFKLGSSSPDVYVPATADAKTIEFYLKSLAG